MQNKLKLYEIFCVLVVSVAVGEIDEARIELYFSIAETVSPQLNCVA